VLLQAGEVERDGQVRDCVAFGRGPIEHIRRKSGFPAFSFAHRNRLNGASSGVVPGRAIDGGDADGGEHQRSHGVHSVHSVSQTAMSPLFRLMNMCVANRMACMEEQATWLPRRQGFG
jgi:hypothetical protein